METITDFEDLLRLFARYEVKYLIVGGLAFIYHAKPRYTKDMDLWVEGSDENIVRANRALSEFGSPELLDFRKPKQVLQLGLAPNRIDLIVDIEALTFDEAWSRRIAGSYGGSPACWIDLESLLRIKSAIDHPRHQDDARVLKQVLEMRTRDREQK
jgi:plasmid maintenance system antidote protein VapI